MLLDDGSNKSISLSSINITSSFLIVIRNFCSYLIVKGLRKSNKSNKRHIDDIIDLNSIHEEGTYRDYANINQAKNQNKINNKQDHNEMHEEI